jgi:hypothetical protein
MAFWNRKSSPEASPQKQDRRGPVGLPLLGLSGDVAVLWVPAAASPDAPFENAAGLEVAEAGNGMVQVALKEENNG